MEISISTVSMPIVENISKTVSTTFVRCSRKIRMCTSRKTLESWKRTLCSYKKSIFWEKMCIICVISSNSERCIHLRITGLSHQWAQRAGHHLLTLAHRECLFGRDHQGAIAPNSMAVERGHLGCLAGESPLMSNKNQLSKIFRSRSF